MALTIVEYLRSFNPNIGLVVNVDGVSYQGITFLYDCKIETGIHIVFATVVGNLTVTYK